MGRSRRLRRAAGIAVSIGRAHAGVAQRFRVVCACPAALGDFAPCQSTRASLAASKFPSVLLLRDPLVLRQLLLDSRHNDALRRHANWSSNAAADRVQPGSGSVLWTIRSGCCFAEASL